MAPMDDSQTDANASYVLSDSMASTTSVQLN